MGVARALACAVVGAAALAAAPSPAAAEDVDEDFQVWLPVTVQVPLVENVLRARLELQPRFGDDARDLDLMMWRPALGYSVTGWLSLWGGYALVERFQPDYSAEHRIWEQAEAAAVVVDDLGLRLLGRLRVEHRVREGDDPVAHRVRFLARAQMPLLGDAPPILLGIVWDEIFVGLNTVPWGPQSGFDRNRTFAGLGVQFATWGRVEAGYLFEVAHRRGSAEDTGVHALAVAVWIDIP